MTPFDQNELDELMNLAMNGGDDAKEEKKESSEDNPSVKDKAKEKIYREPKKKAANFKFPYQSPVIKKDNTIYNPEFDISDSEKKVVVRSPDNYYKFGLNK